MSIDSTDNPKTSEISHSGSSRLPEEMREHPVIEAERPLVEEYKNLRTPQTTEDLHLTPVKPETIEIAKPWYKRTAVRVGGTALLAAGVSAALVVAFVLPKGDTSNNSDPNEGDGPVAEGPVTPGEGTGSDQGGEVIDDPNRVSPEEIVAMSPEELTAFATITPEEAPTPDAYAAEFVKVYDAWINSGGTIGEFSPYENAAKDTYETALADKYDPVFKEALFSWTTNTDNITEVHKAVLNGYRGDLIYEDTKSLYNAHAELQTTEFVSEQPDGAFTMRITIHSVDNIEESASAEAGVNNRNNADGSFTWELSVFVDENNTYKISALHKL